MKGFKLYQGDVHVRLFALLQVLLPKDEKPLLVLKLHIVLAGWQG